MRFDQTGKAGAATRCPARTFRKAGTPPATTGLWNAQATGIARAETPPSLSAVTA